MIITRRRFIRSSGAGLIAATVPRIRAQNEKPRLARKDSFFGVHLDLHPNQSDTMLGRDITEETIEAILRRVQPDYVQYDCKGHPGYAGYPTKIGTPSPGIVKDSLEIWRRVTARNGVALYIHYSGVWDGVACERHPEWSAMHADGTRDNHLTSTFGPYVDQLLIPQLEEVAQRYDLDGAWIDGECWAVIPDFSPVAARAFAAATGIQNLPKKPGDPGWREFLDFNRGQFRKYVRHYLDALHASRPSFQIASNWLYSTYVPEKPELPVDFLSGDYLGNAAISTARLESRYLSSTGKPWDLMAWGFQNSGDIQNHKPAVQLLQEASVVLEQGGGFQVYFVPSRAGHLEESFVGVMEKLSRFCRARQALCHKSDTLPQVGVVFSRHSLYKLSNRMFGGWGAAVNPARGVIDALVENHYSVDVVPDWSLDRRLARYPLVVLPDWPDIGTEARDTLVDYARRGGQLLVIGAENAALFNTELKVKLLGSPLRETSYVLGREVLGNLTGLWQKVDPAGTQTIENRFTALDTTRNASSAATLTGCGSGRIAAIYGPLGSAFAAFHSAANREFIDRVVRRLFTPDVEIEGPPTVEVALRKKSGRMILHLTNTTSMQVGGDYAVNDFVAPVGPVKISIRIPAPPGRVALEPGGMTLNGSWGNGKWNGVLERLEIHAMVVVNEV